MSFLNQNVLDPNNGTQKNPKSKKSVYIALSIFLVTLGIAGLSTYKSIKKLTSNHSKTSSSQASQTPSKTSAKGLKELPGKEPLKEDEKTLARKPILEKSSNGNDDAEQIQETSSESISELEIQYPVENNVLNEFSNMKKIVEEKQKKSREKIDKNTKELNDFLPSAVSAWF